MAYLSLSEKRNFGDHRFNFLRRAPFGHAPYGQIGQYPSFPRSRKKLDTGGPIMLFDRKPKIRSLDKIMWCDTTNLGRGYCLIFPISKVLNHGITINDVEGVVRKWHSQRIGLNELDSIVWRRGQQFNLFQWSEVEYRNLRATHEGVPGAWGPSYIQNPSLFCNSERFHEARHPLLAKQLGRKFIESMKAHRTDRLFKIRCDDSSTNEPRPSER